MVLRLTPTNNDTNCSQISVDDGRIHRVKHFDPFRNAHNLKDTIKLLV